MSMLRRFGYRYASFLVFILMVIVWEGACDLLKVPPYILPAPSAIAKAFTTLPLQRWLQHSWATIEVALLGFIMATIIAVPLAIAITRSKLASRIIMPWLIVIQSTPIVAIAPIIVVTLGAGTFPRVVITTLISFFPIVVSTATGLASVPEEYTELSRSLRAPQSREYWQIRMPYTLPYMFSALRVAITLSIVGAVVAEFVAAEHGLGYLILFSTSSFKIATAFAALMLLIMSSLLLYGALTVLQRRLFPWSEQRN